MNNPVKIFSFERVTVAEAIRRFPRIQKLLLDVLDLRPRMKVSLRVQPRDLPVEISPTIYDYTTRHVMAAYGDKEVIRYVGCADNPQDVLAHTGGALGTAVPEGGIFVVADNHGRGTICIEIWSN